MVDERGLRGQVPIPAPGATAGARRWSAEHAEAGRAEVDALLPEVDVVWADRAAVHAEVEGKEAAIPDVPADVVDAVPSVEVDDQDPAAVLELVAVALFQARLVDVFELAIGYDHGAEAVLGTRAGGGEVDGLAVVAFGPDVVAGVAAGMKLLRAAGEAIGPGEGRRDRQPDQEQGRARGACQRHGGPSSHD